MRRKKTPMRMCIGCGEMKPKNSLVRVVKAPSKQGEDGTEQQGAAVPGKASETLPEIDIDLTGKKPGRGAYLCRDAECLRKARKARRLERAFSCKISEELYLKMEGTLNAG